MDKLKIYQVAAVGMLLLNLGLLAFLVLSPPGPRERPGRPADRLGLDEAQHQAFVELAEEHRRTMRRTTDRQRELLRAYFNGLTQDGSGELPAELLTLEEEKISRTYDHLRDVKGLLRPEQTERYPGFVQQAVQRILMDKRKPQPGDKKPRR